MQVGRLEKTTLRGADAALMNVVDITQRLDALVERRFVVQDDVYYLSIVLPIVGA